MFKIFVMLGPDINGDRYLSMKLKYKYGSLFKISSNIVQMWRISFVIYLRKHTKTRCICQLCRPHNITRSNFSVTRKYNLIYLDSNALRQTQPWLLNPKWYLICPATSRRPCRHKMLHCQNNFILQEIE